MPHAETMARARIADRGGFEEVMPLRGGWSGFDVGCVCEAVSRYREGHTAPCWRPGILILCAVLGSRAVVHFGVMTMRPASRAVCEHLGVQLGVSVHAAWSCMNE